ncbi:MAG: MoxR family ATPase, partial [Lachnospiraceae bacterium]|nr:MoxR family ATPase [Lachnospiraceae bacterium]
RFMMRLSVGYPEREQEIRMAAQFLSGQTPDKAEPVCKAEDILKIKAAVFEVTVKESMLRFMEDIVALTRQEERFVLGASPRALLALMRASQARAFLQGRDYVKPDDVKAVAMQVLLHRLVLSSEARMQKSGAEGILKSLILKVKVPVE